MNSNRFINGSIGAITIFLFFLPVYAFGEEILVPMRQHIEGLLGARVYGFGEFGQIITIVLAVLGVVGGFAGAVGYQWIRRDLSEKTADEIRLSDCILLVDLGMKYYAAYSMTGLHKDATIAALNSSIAVTDHALTVVGKLAEDNARRRSLKALIGTNLAYFYADLSRLAVSDKTTSLSKENVLRLLGDIAFDVQVLERYKHVSFQVAWYNVLESSLNAEFRVIGEIEHKKKILSRVDQLVSDSSLPAGWRYEIEREWKDLRREVE